MEEISEREMLRRVIASALLEVHTSQPGRVESYDAERQVADVLPEVRPGGEALPVIPCVPVIWPRGGGAYLHLPLERGDTGLIVSCEVDVAHWRVRGQPGVPGDTRRHHLAHSVFLPGLAVASATLQTSAGATVLAGSDLRLGAADADQQVLGGNDTKDAMNTWLSALSTWMSAVKTAVLLPGGDLTSANETLDAASTALVNSLETALSSVKVKGS